MTEAIVHVSALAGSRAGAARRLIGAPPLPCRGVRTARLTSLLAGAIAVMALSLPSSALAVLQPTVTLNSPGATPLLTPTPTLTGTAGNGIGDSPTVSLTIHPGPDTSMPPVETVSGSQSNGSFSITIQPGLPDGQYTAVASQSGIGGTGMSAPQTFRIKANAPGVTLEQLADGASTNAPEPLFFGGAGVSLGDSAQVTVSLYSGDSTAIPPTGTVTVSRANDAWQATWPTPLSPGLYTVQATQTDDVGHVGASPPHTFLELNPNGPVGSSVRLSRAGNVSVAVTCTTFPGQRCTGALLILTTRRFRPQPSGPTGPIRVLFAHVDIPAGTTQTVTRPVGRRVARALRRAKSPGLRVQSAISQGGAPIPIVVTRNLSRGS